MSKTKLIPVETLRTGRMVLPSTGMPVNPRSLYDYMEQLGIEPVMQRVNGKGQAIRHVTEAQADELEKLFKNKHWRKFKAAEQK